jgi:multimeric flavodoxin WrbA
MADAYAEAASAAGHEVRRIEVAKLEFPLLRTQADFETGALPPALVQPRDDMRWAEPWVFLFPLWHGTMPALFKLTAFMPCRPCFACGNLGAPCGFRRVCPSCARWRFQEPCQHRPTPWNPS